MAVRLPELIGGAIANVSRRKLRATLTVIAVFIGAFTLALTSGIGTGVRQYIDAQVQTMGAAETLFVSAVDDKVDPGDLRPFDPDETGSTATVGADDLRTVRALDAVDAAELAPAIQTSFIRHGDGQAYRFGLGDSIPGMTFSLVAGDQLDYDGAAPELVLPESYLDDLGFDTPADAVGEDVVIGVRDVTGTLHDVDVSVVGVIEPTLLTDAPRGNYALTVALFDAQSTGLPDDLRDAYPGLVAEVSDVTAATEQLEDAGYQVSSLRDQLGEFQNVVDGIVLVLNIFAVLALLTAAFGIVNVLLMSVQERTREIGILRALGMSRAQIFAQIAIEAVWIALLGAVLAVLAAIGVGAAVSGPLATVLGVDALTGLTLIAFTPDAVITEIVVIVLIALVAALLPAARAARLDPIEAMRNE